MTKKQNKNYSATRWTQKQETFCLKYLELGRARDAALIAGYKPKYVDSIASNLLLKPAVKERLAELRKLVQDSTIATVTEIDRTLTNILRTTPSDLLNVSDDGRDLTIDKEALKSPAVTYISTEQKTLGKMPVRLTRVNMADKIRAADLLCKMKGVYAADTKNVYNDIKILVVREQPKAIEG